ncbi:hypothetical protein NKDENANG_03874 [Candidatus Entotheonellaceae bacterium PAL068K]
MQPAEEQQFIARLEDQSQSGSRVITAAGAVRQALQHLGGIRKVTLATSYDVAISRQGKAYLDAHRL